MGVKLFCRCLYVNPLHNLLQYDTATEIVKVTDWNKLDYEGIIEESI